MLELFLGWEACEVMDDSLLEILGYVNGVEKDFTICCYV